MACAGTLRTISLHHTHEGARMHAPRWRRTPRYSRRSGSPAPPARARSCLFCVRARARLGSQTPRARAPVRGRVRGRVKLGPKRDEALRTAPPPPQRKNIALLGAAEAVACVTWAMERFIQPTPPPPKRDGGLGCQAGLRRRDKHAGSAAGCGFGDTGKVRKRKPWHNRR